MDNRQQRMDEFLQFLANVLIDNPDFDMNYNAVYANFVRIGCDYNEIKQPISGNFDYWINRFETIPNIDVFHTENFKYFCQFTNGNIVNERTHIKMYVPLKREYITEGANILFEFLARNNIQHHSKIGSEIRNDSIVLRMTSISDANIVAEFVNSHEYIKEGLIKANPFMLTDGNISYATDANLSYSNEFSKYISSYLKSLNKSQLKNANSAGLLEYIQNQYNSVFINGNPADIATFEHEHKFADLQFQKRLYSMANATEVTKLIICSLNGENDLNRVGQIYEELMNPNHMQQVEEHISRNYQKIYREPTETIEIKSNETKVNKEEILRDVILLTLDKYGYEHTIRALERLYTSGEVSSITRDNGARDKVKQLSNADIRKVMEDTTGKIDFRLYINTLVQNKTLRIKEDILENASMSTLGKYGVSQLFGALTRAKVGDFKAFTNDNSGRDLMLKNINKGEIEYLMQDILKSNGIINSQNIQTDFVSLIEKRLREYIANDKNNIK